MGGDMGGVPSVPSFPSAPHPRNALFSHCRPPPQPPHLPEPPQVSHCHPSPHPPTPISLTTLISPIPPTPPIPQAPHTPKTAPHPPNPPISLTTPIPPTPPISPHSPPFPRPPPIPYPIPSLPFSRSERPPSPLAPQGSALVERCCRRWPRLRRWLRRSCTVCGEKETPPRLHECPSPACGAAYCAPCWRDVGRVCPACGPKDAGLSEDSSEEGGGYAT